MVKFMAEKLPVAREGVALAWAASRLAHGGVSSRQIYGGAQRRLGMLAIMP